MISTLTNKTEKAYSLTKCQLINRLLQEFKYLRISNNYTIFISTSKKFYSNKAIKGNIQHRLITQTLENFLNRLKGLRTEITNAIDDGDVLKMRLNGHKKLVCVFG